MPETVLKALLVLTNIDNFFEKDMTDWETNTMEAPYLIPNLRMSKW